MRPQTQVPPYRTEILGKAALPCLAKRPFRNSVSTKPAGKPSFGSTAATTIWGCSAPPKRRPRTICSSRNGSLLDVAALKIVVKSESGKPVPISVNEVLLAFWRHTERYYRHPDGRPTSEIKEYKYRLRPVRELYGTTSAISFGPRALAAVRQRRLDADVSCSVINRRIGRIVRAFKWASSEELVPVAAFESLRTLAGLRRGRTDARESEPVQPVELAHVTATLPHLDAHLRTMAEIQRFTGMRPGKVCDMTLTEVDRGARRGCTNPLSTRRPITVVNG